MHALATREYKIAVVGSTGVGKSSLCLQFVRNKFPENYEPTVEDYYRKQVTIDGEQVMFDIIDTPGQERNIANLSLLIKQAHGFLLVFDITRQESLMEANEFRNRILHDKNCSMVPLILVGNKVDKSEQRQVSYEIALKKAVEWNCRFWEVSAKTKFNLDCVFVECARMIKIEIMKSRHAQRACCACAIV